MTMRERDVYTLLETTKNPKKRGQNPKKRR
jgi:hypothetical protein